MKAILFGGSGQVGQALYPPLLAFVSKLSGILYTPPRYGLDLQDTTEISTYIRLINPDIIINAAAYTAVDLAEKERDTALSINCFAAGAIASAAAKVNAYLVHYSTDYVFDGLATIPYTEKDFPNPVNYYGETKLFGDHVICDGVRSLRGVILRTSWVYSTVRSNFYKAICEKYRSGEVPQVVADQFGCPTSSAAIAKATLQIIKKDYPGRPIRVYNLACLGSTSWLGFAAKIANLHGWEEPKSCTTADYPCIAARPKYTVLDSSLLLSGGIDIPHWKTALEDVVRMDQINAAR